MLKGAGGPVNAQIIDINGSSVTTGNTTTFLEKDGGAQVSSTPAVHAGNGSWRYTASGPDSDADHFAVTFVNDAGGLPVTVNVYPFALSAAALTNLVAVYDTFWTQSWDNFMKRWQNGSDVYGTVRGTFAATNTQFESDAFAGGTSAADYIGGRIVWPNYDGSGDWHAIVTDFDPVNDRITHTTAPRVPSTGRPFIFTFPKS